MVQLSTENEVFAGGWDGQLTHWDSEGNHRWTTPTNDRISAIALNDASVAVASGLHVVVLSRSSGEIQCLQRLKERG